MSSTRKGEQIIPTSDQLKEASLLIDVRAPVEFAQGALPGAINLPLMDDDERAQVGTCYRHNGGDAALRLGHQLVSGALRDSRIAAWRDAIARHPDALIYCARGGQRSGIAQRWLAEEGLEVPRLKGGFKAARRALMTVTEQAAEAPSLVIAGLTGCAKTDMIKALDSGIDLEGHARHKGSSFGRQPGQPPTQIDFEHALAMDLASCRAPYVFEDESRRIGSVEIPLPLWHGLCAAPRVLIEMPLEWRLAQIRRDYIDDLWTQYRNAYGPWLGWALMRRQLVSALVRLKKRLGSARLERLLQLQQQAFEAHVTTGDSQAHDGWLSPLLSEYYDPMYHYQLRQAEQGPAFTGSWQEVLAFVREAVDQQRQGGEVE
ncbi:tRNA 2-selenouridine(34) synthase MnmH [Kushneria indalinina]|uniref:tRNA 2-selenouridine synthase n=1 Tax=Kushneria indalinina DSM 14324 TaxID=1122140 RepID=A0A3D9DRN0_9GAMM|nr:tRNA 2-selenouridine(34) synthase MnmH [Kushneria indalinina]REC93413.1 tRNA 2-selenouridine synthase [Kushneria indalinina DSM 14324]